MASEGMDTHPVADLYTEEARRAEMERYDGLISAEKLIELRAIFGLTIVESDALARKAEQQACVADQSEVQALQTGKALHHG